ncbi:MAG TPA: hypothetical protein VM848_15670 [Acidimicrobiia bacterium]|nr:hypothetical protein [Acidimicrobiia bacterium]
MRRHHPTRTLLVSLVFLVACGGGERGSLPDGPSSAVTSTSGVSQPDDLATTTTTKPEVTTESLPATTTTSAGSAATTTTTEPTTSTTAEPAGVVQVPESMLSSVIEDAASRQSVGLAAVTVLSGQPVDWSDGSLGCPEPGMSYTQVLTPGYLVMVDAGGATLEYHLNQQGAFKQCSGGVYHPPSGY